jgi:Cytochrome P460
LRENGDTNVSSDTFVQLKRSAVRDVIELPRRVEWIYRLGSTMNGVRPMHTALKWLGALATCAAAIVILVFVPDAPAAGPAQDKYSLKVPGGLAFSEFNGYEGWQAISVSHDDRAIAVIVGNPAMIDAFKAGIPANGKPVPDGAKMAKIHWIPKKSQYFPDAIVPGEQHDVDFMVKDSKRFADGGGWGYAAFQYDASSDVFRPGTTSDNPPQSNDAKCGVACHTIAKSRDYVFTEYGHR